MKEVGGYFGLELPIGVEYHQDGIRLNTGRNAFEYILRAKKYKKVYLPYYTCDVMLEPIHKLNLSFEFYTIDENFYPKFDFKKISSDEVLVYTNYFGICKKQLIDISKKVENLIVDNSQAFYDLPIDGVDTFYSPRKFFGLADGAYLYTDKFLEEKLEKDISFQRFEHLLGRLDINAQSFYTKFVENDKSLINQPIKEMSNLSQRILSSIDYNKVENIRKENFNLFHSKLKNQNLLKLEPAKDVVPMVYPFFSKKGSELKRKLIDNKVYVATYWSNVYDWAKKDSFEYDLVENLICLPVDQRYEKKEMYIILNNYGIQN